MITLSPGETELFDFLISTTKDLNVTLRIAGGWVRDKILGNISDDIDISIETISGNLVTGEQIAHMISQTNNATVSVIKTNPEKSKHIETAQITVMGYHLEFCHLRKDDYTNDSRIPTILPATPQEDARRRDFTCNALSYNLSTQQIEDYVNGLDDIKNKVLRCPLNPIETFDDDPLRILRCIRFAAKLDFQLDASIREILIVKLERHNEPFFTHGSKDIILDSLTWNILKKVSRERYGIEIKKMLSGPDPVRCVSLLDRSGLLYSTILIEMYPSKTHYVCSLKSSERQITFEKIVTVIQPKDWKSCFDVTEDILYSALLNKTHLNSDDKLIVSLFSLLAIPLVRMVNINISNVLAERTQAIIQHGLKFPKKVYSDVLTMLNALAIIDSDVMNEIKNTVINAYNDKLNSTKIDGNVRLKLFHALRCMRSLSDDVIISWLNVVETLIFNDVPPLTDLFTKSVIVDTALFNCGKIIPMIRGDAIISNVLPDLPSQQINEVLTAELYYQLNNPDATIEEITHHLQKVFKKN